MRFIVKLSALFALLILPSFAQTPVDVQPVKKLIPTGTLGTCGYQPTAKEAPFYNKLESKERVTGSMFQAYDIHKESNHYVAWFGVVRGVKTDSNGTTTLLLEQKFFDGMTDCHIMLVSREGGGDFNAVVDRPEAPIPPLTLVRVYGRVSSEKNGLPQIDAQFLRLWPWLTFTFTDLGPGEDHTNPRWAAYCKICKGRIYNPYPDENYYLNVLGDPKDFATAR
jgi:hypothetical protein